ncbi:UNVERIFIED_CONTAM: hypothetical protein PYX00_008405 [Menopon gallinae]|uniref:Uncharacterized protein n=1 Tax=Menopon gallinae TaxID=328185 RepID=A0AAW2HN46_9NEOP
MLNQTTYGFEKNISITKMTKMGRPQAKSFTQFVCILLVSIFICSKRFKSIDMLLRMTVILSALSLIGGMVVFITYTRTSFSLATIFSFHHEALLQPTCWVTAFRRVTEILNISSGGHVFLGSYMNYETPSHYWVSRAMGYFLIYICLFHIHIHFAEGLLFCRLTTNTLGLHSVNDAIFVLYATELGITATPNLWTLIHFLTYFILGLTTLIMQIMLVNETLCAELKITSWHLYIKVSYCVIIFLFSIPLMTPGGHLIIDNIDLELKVVNCVAVCLIFIIMCLYGLQRMKDDIYYTLDLSPTWYMQACWMISSIVSVIILVIQGLQTGTDYEVFVLRSLMHVTLGAPVLIGFIYKVIQYFGRRNITGIFRASAEYGDPDPTIRLYRILYNRRLEVRYRRRIETCKHRCLLNSDMASKAVEREFVQLQHAVFDLHNNEEFKGEYNDVMAMLDTHIKVLSTYFDNTL